MKLVYLVLATTLLAGCGGEEFEDLQLFVKNSGADMRGKIPSPPTVKVYETFVYVNDTNIADPFKPRKPEPGPNNKPGVNEPDFDRPKEALEEFPLENLKMVGYVMKGKVGHAVVRAPDGKLHQVKAGNHLGMNFGLITKISPTDIKLKEVVQDSSGDWSGRESSLQLIE